MIPTSWRDERHQLIVQQIAQTSEDHKWADDEEVITDLMVNALNDLPVTDAELTELANSRGEYRAGDTRGYVIARETECVAYNCWMIREPNGDTKLVSEAPRGKT